MRSVPADAVYGFAVMPVGFFAQFARHRRVHPVAELNGGIIASTEPIPEPSVNATGLNFVFSVEGGVRWDIGTRSAVTAGYRFLHLERQHHGFQSRPRQQRFLCQLFVSVVNTLIRCGPEIRVMTTGSTRPGG